MCNAVASQEFGATIVLGERYMQTPVMFDCYLSVSIVMVSVFHNTLFQYVMSLALSFASKPGLSGDFSKELRFSSLVCRIESTPV